MSELMSDINPLIAAAGAAALALQSDSDSDSDNSRVPVTVTVIVTQSTTDWPRILRRTVITENPNVDAGVPLSGQQA